MAKPRPDLPPVEALTALLDSAQRLAVRVTPGAREEGLAIEAGRVVVKVRAKPQDGAANAAVLGLLATALAVAPSRLTLVRGATARDKVIQLD